MSEHHDPLEALRHVAEFLDLLADQAKATSQAIHDAIPDQVDLAPRPVSTSPRPLKSPQAGDFGEGRKD